MKQTNIKLSERQLADLFKQQTIQNTSKSDAIDCLSSAPASTSRIDHVEEIANDYAAAQGMKASFALKEWATVLSDSINNSRQSWLNFLGMGTPMKTAIATASFAFAFAFALPVITQFSQQEKVHMSTIQNSQSLAQDDVIKKAQFDENNDRLNKHSFDNINQDNKTDQLFNGSFG